MQIIVKKLKNEKEVLDNQYMPKVYVGAYAGRNGNNNQFTHDSYGVNFNLVMPLGSSVVQSNGNTGVQKTETEFKPIPDLEIKPWVPEQTVITPLPFDCSTI